MGPSSTRLLSLELFDHLGLSTVSLFLQLQQVTYAVGVYRLCLSNVNKWSFPLTPNPSPADGRACDCGRWLAGWLLPLLYNCKRVPRPLRMCVCACCVAAIASNSDSKWYPPPPHPTCRCRCVSASAGSGTLTHTNQTWDPARCCAHNNIRGA